MLTREEVMGHGNWDDDTYAAGGPSRAARRLDDFGYTSAMKARSQREWQADPSLDPFGVTVRECRDSGGDAGAKPIAVLFDVTGSMGRVPQIMQRKLGKLHGLLRRKEYVA